LPETEILVRAKDWAETLFEIIPEDRLKDAFDHAARTRQNAFPVSAYDLITAWTAINKTEREAKAAELASVAEQLERDRFTAHYRECSACYGSGWRTIKRSEPSGQIYPGSIKCRECRYWPNSKDLGVNYYEREQ